MKKLLQSLTAITIFLSVPAAAQHSIEEGISFLDTTELKRVYGKGAFVLVNTLSPVEFQERRIAGSINIPLSHYAQGKASLPGDKDDRFVFYCMGAK